MKSILFVCTGNTCRSSMAEAMFKDMLTGAGPKIGAASAGTAVFCGQGASKHAVEVMKGMGIDLSGHTSRPVGLDDLDRAGLVLTMTRAHKRMVLELAPEASEKVFTLKEYVYRDLKDAELDIPDPFGGSVKEYRVCALEIRDALEKLVEKLKEEWGR